MASVSMDPTSVLDKAKNVTFVDNAVGKEVCSESKKIGQPDEHRRGVTAAPVARGKSSRLRSS
jgi:hypothetical protein